MFNQKKVMDGRIFKQIRMLSILFLAVLNPLTGYTADLDSDLINAVLKADTATVNALLATGSDVNSKNRDGETVLILAAKYGHTDTVKVLLAEGADLNARDRFGETALTCAKRCGHMKITRLLKEAGAKE